MSDSLNSDFNVLHFIGRDSVVNLRQLRLGEVLNLSGIQKPRMNEHINSLFLSYVITDIAGSLPKDVRLLPIDVRYAIICHYIAYAYNRTRESVKNINFKVSEHSKYSDYLDAASNDQKIIESEMKRKSPIDDKFLKYVPLNGYALEVLEMRCKTRSEFLVGSIVFELRDAQESEIEANLAAYINYFDEKINSVHELGDFDFDALDELRNELTSFYPYLFWREFDDDGVCFAPYKMIRDIDDEGVASMPYARFCAHDIFKGKTWL